MYFHRVGAYEPRSVVTVVTAGTGVLSAFSPAAIRTTGAKLGRMSGRGYVLPERPHFLDSTDSGAL